MRKWRASRATSWQACAAGASGKVTERRNRMVCSSLQLAIDFLENLADHGASARPVLRMSRSRGGVQVRSADLNPRLVGLRFLDCGLRGSGLGDRAAGTFQVSL